MANATQHNVTALLAEIEKLKTENKKLKNTKKYGLVWEDTPEKLDEGNIIPLVKEKKDLRIVKNANENMNYLIEGDNYHSLLALQKTHLGKIDVIYIDPPYNTGNEFVYNDKIVDKEDNFRHSKWLSFMSKRLKLAKKLLSEDGVIFVSIDEYEFAQLKLLMDSIYGENNFLGTITWDKRNAKGNVNRLSHNTEYIHVYAKNKNGITSMKVNKSGAKDMLNKVKELANTHVEYNKVLRDYRKYLNENKELKGGERAYNKLTSNYRIYRTISMDSPKMSKNKYDIIHPKTKKPCKLSSNGWRYKKTTMEEMLKRGEVEFGIDHTTIPQKKLYLDEYTEESMTTMYSSAENGIDDLTNMGFDKKIFDNPKPINLIKHLISVKNKNATVLDFFAGSGTTGHAVMELNKEDGGNRKFILCTNNEVSEEKVRQHFISQGLLDKNTKTAFTKFRQENETLVNQFYKSEEYQKLGIARSVTYERLKRVIEGYTTPKGKFVEGLTGNNLIYLQTKELEVKNEIIIENSDDVKLYNALHGTTIPLLDEVLPIVKLRYNDKNTVVVPIEDTYEMPDLTEEKYKDKSTFVFLVDDSDKEIVPELTAILAEEFTSYNCTIEVTSTYIQP